MLKVNREVRAGRPPRLTKEQKDEVVKGYNAGKTFKQLSEEFSCSMSTIRNCIHERS